jgi:hypothetical protein
MNEERQILKEGLVEIDKILRQVSSSEIKLNQINLALRQGLLNNKKKQFSSFLTRVKGKLSSDDQDLLELLLEAQLETKKGNNLFIQKQSEAIRKVLTKSLRREELQTLLEEQKEVIKLEEQLKEVLQEQQQTNIEIPPK